MSEYNCAVTQHCKCPVLSCFSIFPSGHAPFSAHLAVIIGRGLIQHRVPSETMGSANTLLSHLFLFFFFFFSIHLFSLNHPLSISLSLSVLTLPLLFLA